MIILHFDNDIENDIDNNNDIDNDNDNDSDNDNDNKLHDVYKNCQVKALSKISMWILLFR